MELSLSECGLNSAQIGKIVQGAKHCGLGRMSFAGNDLDDQGLEHILDYIRSGICTAIDIGSNDLRGKLGRLAEALSSTKKCPVWGLSLVNCNLDTETLKSLFPALVSLPDFRFIDLSHNKHLFDNDAAGGIHLLRRYIPKLSNLIRLHLMDVGLSTKQAIALAEVSSLTDPVSANKQADQFHRSFPKVLALLTLTYLKTLSLTSSPLRSTKTAKKRHARCMLLSWPQFEFHPLFYASTLL